MLAQSLFLLSLGALSRGASPPRAPRLMPSITSSFVNVGKIDVVVHVNKQPADSHQSRQSSLFKPQRYMFEEEPCPCTSALKSLQAMPNPSKLLNMIFGNKKESSSCCDSSEHIHEETIIYDIGPRQQQLPSFISKPIIPFTSNITPNAKESPIIYPLEYIFPNSLQKLKPLPVIPEEKPTTTTRLTSSLQGKKSPVKFVGGNNDKILEQIKNLKFRQSLPVFHKNTVKKDLNLQKVADEVNAVLKTEATSDVKSEVQTTVGATTVKPTEVPAGALNTV